IKLGRPMGLLFERALNPHIPRHREMLDAGGLWVVPNDVRSEEVVAEVKERGIRALEINYADTSFLRELPQLEFLQLGHLSDPRPIHYLEQLRALNMSSGWA